jgi:hypothetical protein
MDIMQNNLNDLKFLSGKFRKKKGKGKEKISIRGESQERRIVIGKKG